MPKQVRARLTARQVATLSKPGFYCDGYGLYLQVKPGGRSWIFRYQGQDGRTHDMGLGSAAYLTLAAARDRAIDLQRLRLTGVDPLAKRREAQAQQVSRKKVVTLAAAMREYVVDKGGSWKPDTRKDFINSIELHAKDLLPVDVAAIDQQRLLRVFHPIWGGSIVRNTLRRVAIILDWATAHGYRSGDNPAAWRRMSMILPTVKRETQHRPALPWRELPAFMAELRARDGIVYRAAEFAILTAARSGEVCGATWGEIDMVEQVWVIPAARMKAGKAHTVPLSARALEILAEMKAIRQNEFVFVGGSSRPNLHGHAMVNAIKPLRAGISLHGFRSTIYGWVRDARTGYPDEMVDVALAHNVPDKVKAAYMRAEMVDARRDMMEDWAKACVGQYQPRTGNVVPLRASA